MPVLKGELLMSLFILSAVVLLSTWLMPAWGWKPEEFPIGFWHGPPPEANTLETWRQVKEANFTFCFARGGYTTEDNRKLLDFCQQLGLRALVIDGRLSWQMIANDDWRKTIAAVVADYGSHPALFGYYVQDEPNYRLFEPLAQINQELLRQDPAHLPYINLFPTYATVEQLGTPTYWDHLEKFLSIVKPAVLSFDHYCLMKDRPDRPDYFENLELIRRAALKFDTPPWIVILSIPHYGYRDPTAADMRWQVFTSLAYGMKGIMYFTYWTEKAWEAEGHIAIVDSAGRPARLYPIVKALNAEILTLGKILLHLKSTGVYHTGEIPQGCARLGSDSLIRLPVDVPLLVGFFESAEGAQYAMIVNRDKVNAVSFEATFLPHVKEVLQVSPVTGKEEPLVLTNGVVKFSLPAGDGRLLRLVTDFRYPAFPSPLTEINFQFNTDGDLEGWEGFHSLASSTVTGGRFVAKFSGDDPYLCRLFLRVPADRYSKIRVRMRLHSGSKQGQFFWATAAEPAFRDDKYMNFTVIPDGEWHEYVVPVGEHPRWRGQPIRAIRLDPVTGGAESGSQVEIDSIVGE